MIPIVLFAFYLAFYFFYWDARNNTIREFNENQLILAQTASKGISSLLDHYKDNLNYLTKLSDISDHSGNYQNLLLNFYEEHQEVINAITRVDSNGFICYTYPYDSSSIGRNISNQRHIQDVFKTHKPVISDVFLSVQGYYTIALHVPVFKQNVFTGSLAVLIPIDKLGQLFLDDIGLNKNGHAWIITENNTEIYCRIDGHERKSFLETTGFDTGTKELIEKIKSSYHGYGKSLHQDTNDKNKGKPEELYVVYHRFPLGSTYWSILISYDEEVVYKELRKFRTQLVIVLFIMFVAAIYYYYSLVKVRNIIKEETKRQKAENLLKDNQVQLRTLINTIPDYIWLKDKNGVYLLCNNRFEEFFGAKESEIVGKTDYDFVDKDLADFFRANDLAAMHANKPTINEEQITHAVDGRLVDLETTKTTLRNSKNELVGILGIAHDITNRNQQKKELKKAKEKAEENDRLKSAFLTNISHEIRTPMNGIMGFTQLLTDQDFSDAEKKSFIKIIEKSGQRMLNTINDIIDISKIESGQVNVNHHEINLDELMDYHYQFFKPEADSKRLKFHLIKSDSSINQSITNDKEKLTAIISNLIKNAIKYTLDGFIEIKYEVSEDEFYISIKDSGIGIPRDKHTSIFDRFVQVSNKDNDNPEGSGIGLSIVKAYTELLGGDISVNSEENKGSTFKVVFPLSAKK